MRIPVRLAQIPELRNFADYVFSLLAGIFLQKIGVGGFPKAAVLVIFRPATSPRTLLEVVLAMETSTILKNSIIKAFKYLKV